MNISRATLASFAALACLAAVAATTAAAQTSAGGNNASAPTIARPDTDSPVAPTPCAANDRDARRGVRSDVIVTLDPDTLWRPRGGEVEFTFGSSTTGTTIAVEKVWVCFRWSNGAPNAAPGVDHAYLESPLVRSVPNTAGAIEYAAVVPDLKRAVVGIVDRLRSQGSVDYTGVYTIPVADMQIVADIAGADRKTERIAVLLPVGVTYVPAAFAVLFLSLLAAAVVLWRWAPPTLLDPGAKGPLHRVSQHILAVISAPDGIASLSQFQIMLWTFVVGGASIYVMTLSGNLISISTGTLTLLGIAGGTSILARIPSKTKPPPGDGTIKPAWAQMLQSQTDGNVEIDVTRVQMLVFTIVTAAFVAIKVAVSYSIPEIPDNFLLLMGISNGVYIAGRQVPNSR